MIPSSADNCIPRHLLRYVPNKAAFKRAGTFCRVLPHLNDLGVSQLGVGVLFALEVKALLFFCDDFWGLCCDKGVVANRAFAIATDLIRLLSIRAGDAGLSRALRAIHLMAWVS